MALSISGTRTTGADIRQQNVQACQAVANIVKSSLGPVGLDKLLVDELGDVTITNDGATILKKLEVEHPAAKVLVELSALQDAEVGDGTTSVVILAAELLKRANELVKQHVHPTSIISGYQRAKKEACRFIAKEMTKKVSELGPECLVNAALTSMSSKLIGKDGNYFAQMCVDAMQAVATQNNQGVTKYPVKAVNILKIVGGASADSELIPGFACEESRASTQMDKCKVGAKIALLDFCLRKKPLKFGIQMVISDPNELEAMRKTETEVVERKCQLIIDSGANVVLTTGGIDDIAIQYMVEHGIIGIRRIPKRKMRVIAKLTGGTLITNLSDMDGEDVLTQAQLGVAEKIEERRVGDRNVTFIMGCSSTSAQTILLRGPNYYMLDEIERSLHDSLCVVKRVLESKRVVPGGGAVEAALSVYLEHVAESMASREQLAIAEFAQALLIIPKTLALNGAHDATDLVAQLRGFHNAAQSDETRKQKYMYTGLNLENGRARDNLAAGVLEPSMSKIKSIKFATEAAVTILRIDDSIKKPQPAKKQ